MGRAQTPTLGNGGRPGKPAGRGNATAVEAQLSVLSSSAQLSSGSRLQAEMRLEIGVLD